jgi:hypothetical protein
MTTVRNQSDCPVTTDVDHHYCLTLNREYDTIHASDRRSRSGVYPTLQTATLRHSNEGPAQGQTESTATVAQIGTALADLMAGCSPVRPA